MLSIMNRDPKGRIIVLGATGQLGRSLCLELKRLGDPYHLLTYTHKALDCTDTEAVRESIIQWEQESISYPWSIIINCVAFTQVDRAEETDRYHDLLALNALLPAQLAESKLPIIHISTDYVFDGLKGSPYREDDKTNPTCLYGRTKRQGELAILLHPLHQTNQHLIIRTQWLWSPWGKNFVRTMLHLAREGKAINVVNDQIGSPTSAPSLAKTICEIVTCYDEEMAFRTPLLHYANRGICSWYDFAYETIATHCPNYDLSQLTPITTADYSTTAQRPPYSVLSTERLTACYDIIPPRWQDELAEIPIN